MKDTKREELSNLYLQYYQLVYNAVIQKVKNVADTEDICQEVFVALYNNLEVVDDPRKWLYGTLKNKVMQYYRNKKSDVSPDDIFNDIALTFVNGFRDTRILLEDVIKEEVKEEEDRRVFELVAINAYSYGEAARLTGATRRQVEYRYTKIVERIVKNLKARGIHDMGELL